MSNYKYKNTTTKNYVLNNFDQFLLHQYNLNYTNGPCSIVQIKDPNNNNVIGVNYYPDNLFFGEKYFVGPQYFDGDMYGDWGEKTEKRSAILFDVYKFVGVRKIVKNNMEFCTALIFEDENGNRFDLLPRSVILNEQRIKQARENNNIELPLYLEERWTRVATKQKHRVKEPFSLWNFVSDYLFWIFVLFLCLIIMIMAVKIGMLTGIFLIGAIVFYGSLFVLFVGSFIKELVDYLTVRSRYQNKINNLISNNKEEN